MNITTGAATLKSSSLRTHRCDESLHRARRHGLRRGLQPGGRSPARRERHRPEPAHQRRHRRDDHRRRAERAGATRTASPRGLHEQLRGACRTALFFLDTTTDNLLTTADPNAGTVTEVGWLGVDAESCSGFEITTAADGTNTAFAVFTVAGAPALYSINPPPASPTAAGRGDRIEQPVRSCADAAAAAPTAPAQHAGQWSRSRRRTS